MRKSGRNPVEPASDGFHGQLENHYEQRTDHQGDDVTGDFFHVTHEQNDDDERKTRECSSGRRECAEISREIFEASGKFARHLVDVEAEEIFDLRTADNDRDAVGEPDDYRARNEFNGGPEARNADDRKSTR